MNTHLSDDQLGMGSNSSTVIDIILGKSVIHEFTLNDIDYLSRKRAIYEIMGQKLF